MTLQECCTLLRMLYGVAVTELDDEAVLADFCAEMRFHPAQDYLYPDTLPLILSSIQDGQTVSIKDAFQVRFLFARLGEAHFAFGPYCSESLSSLNARTLLSRIGADGRYTVDLLAYRSRFPVLNEAEALRIVRAVISFVSGWEFLPPPRILDLQSPPIAPAGEEVHIPYAEAVSERYAVELDMMRAIEHGNTVQAIRDWRGLHRRMEYLKKQLGYSLETARSSAAVTRTVIRIAGLNAGLPAVVLDQITGEISHLNQQAKTLDEIEANTERLIREMCRQVRRNQHEGNSYLVSSVKHHIEAHFTQDLTVAQIAEQLELPESRLIEQFRRETGMTPGKYLRRVRMAKAAELLLATQWHIQRIAAECGISDANYFVKLFKAEHGMTPSAYRVRRRTGET